MELDTTNQQQTPIQTEPQQIPVRESITNQRGFVPFIIGFVILLIVAVGGAYYLGTKSFPSKSLNAQQATPNPTSANESMPTATSNPTIKVEATKTPSNAPVVNGVSLSEIKYTLPQGWKAEIRKNALNEDGLELTPESGGGFLWIQVYDYPGTSGRREYYCQVSKVCIEGTSYFNKMSLGNISGYSAHALDNSGGGTEYFGAKGNKFYIISSFSPHYPNEFGKNYMNMLNSLKF